MSFSIHILGSGSAVPTKYRNPSAHLLQVDEHFYLIDCGEATQMQLVKYGFNLLRIHHIFISHLHGDHVFGLFGLLSTMILQGRKKALTIYANADLQRTLDFFLSEYGQRDLFKIQLIPFESRARGLIFKDKKIEVKTFPLKHTVPTQGFVFREIDRERSLIKQKIEQYSIPIAQRKAIKQGASYEYKGSIIDNEELTLPPTPTKSYAYCTDTYYYESIIEWVKDTDVLYHEATFLAQDQERAKKTLHATAHMAAEIAKQAGVGKLVVGHFSARYKSLEPFLEEAQKIFLATELASEGKTINIE